MMRPVLNKRNIHKKILAATNFGDAFAVAVPSDKKFQSIGKCFCKKSEKLNLFVAPAVVAK